MLKHILKHQDGGAIGGPSEKNISEHRASPSAIHERRYSNGDIYEGEVKMGMRHGRGVYTFANGSVYDGEWKENQPHGMGIFKYADGSSYKGQHKYGLKWGQGTYICANGDKYTGEWKRNSPLINIEKPKKKNDVVTVLFRSKKMADENRVSQYEKDKFRRGGKEITTIVMSNGDKLDQLLKKSGVPESRHEGELRFIFHEHAVCGGSDVRHTSRDFTNLLKLCFNHDVRRVIFSDASCRGAATRLLRGATVPRGMEIKHYLAKEEFKVIETLAKDTKGRTRFVQRCFDKEGKMHKRDMYIYRRGNWSLERW